MSLIGQCEISHPVRKSSFSIDNDLDDSALNLASPTDDLRATLSKPKNMMFNAGSKVDFEALDAPISSEYPCALSFIHKVPRYIYS